MAPHSAFRDIVLVREHVAWERAWVLKEAQVRAMQHVLHPSGVLHETLRDETAELIFEIMMNSDEVDTRISTMTWHLAIHIGGSARPAPDVVRRVWARLVMLESTLSRFSGDQLRQVDLEALREEVGPLNFTMRAIRAFSVRRAPTGDHLRAIISGWLVASETYDRLLPADVVEGVSHMRNAQVPEVLAALILGRDRRERVTAALRCFKVNSVADLVPDGPEILSDDELVELADFGLNRHGRYHDEAVPTVPATNSEADAPPRDV